ncbi:TonB-dependent receptor [Sphingomonas sp.]|jgi:outer membrane receptor protein involved in Fe transport|uniref:TonB-dependent receptor domain-containing protein n=1 Tax=Sphingomonas sp. TaxID=28214 RepID=UPI0026301816|nr:TonB-dependent receptor [Sphingomonas sp.]MDF2604937.1 TonB-dependent receptor [Sphingomonas sp.]
MRTNFRSRLLTTTLFVGAVMASPSALAQQVDSTTTPGTAAPGPVPQEGASNSETSTGDIVVTGTLIRNPNLVQATPVKVVGADEIDLQQANVAEELLRELPGITPSIGSAVNNGNGGASFANLRNLGSNRNVVLLDGVRLVPAELNGRFDLNNVPLALIERVDVLTGGASTTYGADAVSGVINFITRRDFSGFEANVSQQISEQGDGNVFRVDATIGANFDDGRGNAVFSVGYQEADAIYQGDRDYGFLALNSATGGGGGSGTAVPSRFSLPGQGTRQVNPAGTDFRPGTAFSAFNFNPYNVYQTPFERYNMYGAADYEISDAVEVYTRGIFSKNTVSTIIAPSGAFGIPVEIPLNNPFLTDALRNTFCSANGISAAACAAAANPALTPGAAGYQTVTSALFRRATEVGPRISEYSTTFFDYRLGFRGGITDTIDWDIFGSYGESENLQSIGGYTLNSRVRDSFLANNTTSCFSGTASGCVPINWFGPEGNATWTDDAIDFLNDVSTVRTSTTLAQARGTISGDFGVSSPLSENPISFAVGGEYRRYTASQQSDTLAVGGDLGGAGGAQPNITGGYDVYEAIGELIVPLVQNRPFFEDLTIEGGIRYSKYTIDAAGDPGYNTTTWKAAGSWTPVNGFKIRGNYARAVRAPNIAELFSPVVTGLTNLQDDPCATFDDNGDRIRPNPTGALQAVCLAQGATPANINSIAQPISGQANSTGGGNLLLRPEIGKSWTVGAVFQPTFVPRLSISVDYFNIKITDAITSPTPGDAITACFGDNPSAPPAGAAASAACTSIRRDPLTGGLNGDPNTTPGLFLTTSNLGMLKTSGIDLTANYAHDLGFAKLSLAGTATWTKESEFQAVTGGYVRDCVGYYSANCGQPIPEWQWSVRGTATFEGIDVSLLWRHIGGTQYEGAAADFADRGFSPTSRVLFSGALPASAGALAGRQVNFNRITAKDYFDLTSRVTVAENLILTVGIQNLFDKEPPLVGGEAGSTTFNSGNTFPSTYDAIGRRFVMGAKIRF